MISLTPGAKSSIQVNNPNCYSLHILTDEEYRQLSDTADFAKKLSQDYLAALREANETIAKLKAASIDKDRAMQRLMEHFIKGSTVQLIVGRVETNV